jgi:RNA polymerase sigma factor (sigma-70 family)
LQDQQRSLYRYLVLRCREHDRTAQNALYKMFASAMYNTCRRITGDDDDAKDALQETFIEVFLKLNTLQNPDLFPAWIKRIAINRSIGLLRKRKEVLLSLDQEEDSHSEEEHDWEYKDGLLEKLVRLLDRLPPGGRMILNLYAFEGYDHQEISQILGITESASKAQYSKAKSKLKTLLEDGKGIG